MDLIEQQNQKEYLTAKEVDVQAAEAQGRVGIYDPDNPPWGIGSALGLWLFSVLALFLPVSSPSSDTC